jgi:hypothetical protein
MNPSCLLLLLGLLAPQELKAPEQLPRLAAESVRALETLENELRGKTGDADKTRHAMVKKALAAFPRQQLKAPPERAAAQAQQALQSLDACLAALLPVSEKPPPPDATRTQKRQRLALLALPQLKLLHAGQKELRETLLPLVKAVQARPDRRATDQEKEQFRALARRQRQLLAGSHLLTALLRSQDEKPPFLEVVRQVQMDMVKLAQRMDVGRVDPVTAVIAKDVEEVLQEMVEGWLQVGRLKEKDVPVRSPLGGTFPSVLPGLCEIREILVVAGEKPR